MRSLHLHVLVLASFCSACAGSTGRGAEEPRAATASDPEEDILLPVGGCDVRGVGDHVKQIVPRSLPWTYFAVEEARVECEERRVLVELGPGAQVWLLSIRDDPNGATSESFAVETLRALEREFQAQGTNATLSAERDATLGEGALRARCGRFDLTIAGEPAVTQVCAAWSRRDGAAHFVIVTITDSEQGFADTGRSVEDLIGGVVDNFTLE